MEASSGSRGLCRDAWGQTTDGDKNDKNFVSFNFVH